MNDLEDEILGTGNNSGNKNIEPGNSTENSHQGQEEAPTNGIDSNSEEHKDVSRRSFVGTSLGVLSLALLGTSGYLFYTDAKKDKEIKKNALPDMKGNLVMFEGEEKPTKEEVKEMDIERDESSNTNGKRDESSLFIVPSVGLEAPMGKLNMVRRNINPPDFQTVYEIRNLGTPLDKFQEGTVYLATHSVTRGVAPGNYLIDIKNERASVHNGDEIRVRGKKFYVTEEFTIPKNDLPRSTKVWESVPGRLVIVTCLQRPSKRRSTRNSIIFAQADLPNLDQPAPASDQGE